MGVESFGFSLITALLGMLLVVLFLVLMSTIMFVIKRVMGEVSAGEPPDAGAASTVERQPDSHLFTQLHGRAGGETTGARSLSIRARAAGETDSAESPGSQIEGGGKLPGWVLAASAAYLYDEERIQAAFVTAHPWIDAERLQGPVHRSSFSEGGRFTPRQT